MARYRSYSLFLVFPVMAGLALLSLCANAEQPRLVQRHIIVFYDLSAVLNRPGSLADAKSVVRDLLLPVKGGRSSPPLWAPGGCISFAGGGTDQSQLNRLRATGKDFWNEWTNTIVRWDSAAPLCTDSSSAINNAVDLSFSTVQQRSVPFGLSSFAFTALFAKEPLVYSNSLIVVRIGDYALDSPELRRLDESYLGGPKTNILRAANSEIEKSFRRNSIAHAKAGGLMIEAFEIQPTGPASLTWDESRALAAQLRSGWRLELPRLRIGSGGAAPVLRFADVQIADGDTQLGPVPLADPQPLLSSSREARVFRVARDLLDQQGNPSVQVLAALNYTSGDFGLHLGTTALSVPIPIQKTLLPPLWQEVAFIWMPGLGGAGFLVWLLFLRRVSFRVDVVRRSDSDIQLVEWKKGRQYIPLKVYKTNRLPLRKVSVDARIATMPDTPGLNLSFGLRSPNQSQNTEKATINIGTLSGRSALAVALAIDLSHTDEPSNPTDVFQVEVKVTAGGKSVFRHVRLKIMPAEGNFWLGIDPGTTGACIAGADQIGDIQLVPLTPGAFNDEEKYVAPSLVYIPKDQPKDQKEVGESSQYRVNGTAFKYFAGSGAEPYEQQSSHIFRSAKRLIGYDNERRLTVNGADVILRGSNAVEMLVKYMIQMGSDHFRKRPSSAGPTPRLNKAVLAVPNTFTPGKIKQMKECCQRAWPGLKVEHIYEAEAVLMFYLWQSDALNGGRASIANDLRLTKRGERIVVFDFGGGSANYTYASVCGTRPIDITVHQRLGFALGGDHLDCDIAHFIWNQVRGDQLVQNLHPFRDTPSTPEKQLRTELLRMARTVKREVSARARKDEWEQIILLSSSPKFEFAELFSRCKTVTPKNVIESEGMVARMQEIVSGIFELVELCEGTGAWKGVDTVLFTGRSTRFPTVQDRIRAVLDTDAHPIDLAEEAKTCVARGAAFWGMARNTVRLRRDPVVFAHFGIGRYANQQQNSLEFVPLVKAGDVYKEPAANARQGAESRHCVGTDGPRAYAYNNRRVDLYQLMGANAQAALSDPEKYARRTLLASFMLDASDSDVNMITLDLKDDDTFESTLEQRSGLQTAGKDKTVVIRDIGEDADKTAKWLVDVE